MPPKLNKPLKAIKPKDRTAPKEFYCVGCKTHVLHSRADKNVFLHISENGRYMLKSKCSKCNMNVCRIISDTKGRAWTGKVGNAPSFKPKQQASKYEKALMKTDPSLLDSKTKRDRERLFEDIASDAALGISKSKPKPKSKSKSKQSKKIEKY